MPQFPTRKKKASTNRHSMHGSGWWDSVGDAFSSVGDTVYYGAVKPAHDWIKDNKIISKGAKAVGNLDATGLVTAAGNAAGLLGYGRKRKRSKKSLTGGMKRRTRKPTF